MAHQHEKIEFGDFQTPHDLALNVCRLLKTMGIEPDVIIEPTCGVGAFIDASLNIFNAKEIRGFDINEEHLASLQAKLNSQKFNNVHLKQADFFATDWTNQLSDIKGVPLVIGNFPWVTNAKLGSIGSGNLPDKSNFLKHKGFDAISGKANFDISEWMLIDTLKWFEGKDADIAMLVKTSVARKVLSYAESKNLSVKYASINLIDAQKYFNAAVDACLLTIRLSARNDNFTHDYFVFKDLVNTNGSLVGHRQGHTISDIKKFENFSFLFGKSPQKWRSGIKHDASSVMELTATDEGLKSGFGEIVDIESTYLYPLLKGSDIGSNKEWRKKYTIVTQTKVGQATEDIEKLAPKTWNYLQQHEEILSNRGSSIYLKNPKFSIFGVGDYAFYPWRIAICGMYKSLSFRLVGPIDGKPVMFDDTVYYISFKIQKDAEDVYLKLSSEPVRGLLSSLIFWDEKRPIKTSILNAVDWSVTDDLLISISKIA